MRAAETCCLFCKLFAGHVALNNCGTKTRGQPRLPPVGMFFEGPVRRPETQSRLPAHSHRARPGSTSGPLGASLLGPASHKKGLAMAKSPSKRRNDWSPTARWQESPHCQAWACAAAMSPRQQSASIRSTAALQPHHQGPSPPASGPVRSAGAICGGGTRILPDAAAALAPRATHLHPRLAATPQQEAALPPAVGS